MPYGINMTLGNVEKINRFLKAAVRDGFDHAMQQHGDLVSLDEATAIKTMQPDQIQAILDISENVLHYREDTKD